MDKLVAQRNHGEHYQADRHKDVPHQQSQQPPAQALFTPGSHVVERFKIRLELQDVAFDLVNVSGKQLQRIRPGGRACLRLPLSARDLSESRSTCPPCSTAIGANMRNIEDSHPIISAYAVSTRL